MAFFTMKLKAAIKTASSLKQQALDVYEKHESQEILKESMRFEELNNQKERNDDLVERKLSIIKEKEDELLADLHEFNAIKEVFEKAKAKFENKQEERNLINQYILEVKDEISQISTNNREIDEEQDKILKDIDRFDKIQKERETKRKKHLEIEEKRDFSLISSNPQRIGEALYNQLMQSYKTMNHLFETDTNEKKFIFEYAYEEDVIYSIVFSSEHERIDFYVDANHSSHYLATNYIKSRSNYFIKVDKEGNCLFDESNEEINQLARSIIQHLRLLEVESGEAEITY